MQNDSATNINQTTDQSLMNTNVGLKQTRKIPRSEEEMADNHTRWESKRVIADQEGTAYVRYSLIKLSRLMKRTTSSIMHPTATSSVPSLSWRSFAVSQSAQSLSS